MRLSVVCNIACAMVLAAALTMCSSLSVPCMSRVVVRALELVDEVRLVHAICGSLA